MLVRNEEIECKAAAVATVTETRDGGWNSARRGTGLTGACRFHRWEG